MRRMSRIDLIGHNGNEGLHYKQLERNDLKDNSVKVLSDVTVFNKYAKYVPELQRRETWEELVYRNMNMHCKKYPHMAQKITEIYERFVITKKVLPSMRSLQFSGRPIELAHNRIYNCAYLPIDHMDAFSELMFLLLGGTGGGYSVQSHHVESLPAVVGTTDQKRRFLIGDSIEGWADAVKVLVEAHFLGKHTPDFDYSDIREKGAMLITTGGKAPGPEPLRICLEKLNEILEATRGNNISTINAHDMCCIIADAVLAGGIRRAALISLFDRDDESMLSCKSGTWWEAAPYRGRANNSAVLERGKVSRTEFYSIMKRVEESGAGEPGVYWSSNRDWGTNPCCEIGLRPYQFCNLCEVNADGVEDQADLEARSRAAAFIGTLQAGYTDFHYLRPVWRETTEKDALIGVGMTGIGSGDVADLDLRAAAAAVVDENAKVAKLLGIRYASRTTTVKPSGTSSLVVGSSSGVHAWHAPYYIRRMRAGKNEALYQYLLEKSPELVEDDTFNPQGGVLSFPQRAPENAILRSESPDTLLNRVRDFNLGWVRPGHNDGDNTHNVSCTISLKDSEWPLVTDWMWANRNDYNGISVLPYDGGTYQQAPFEDCTKEEYERMLPFLEGINLKHVSEEVDNTDLQGEQACAGGACEV